MAKKFKIITLGCKVNQYESAYIKEALKRAGWKEVSKDENADVDIVNTCIVTQRASYQSRQAIRKAIRENPSALIAAIGCYAQVFPEELSEIQGVSLVAGNTVKGRLPEILRRACEEPPSRKEGREGIFSADQDTNSGGRLLLSHFARQMPFEFLPMEEFPDRTRGFLKIQDGCDSFCTYCIVPLARGPLRSLDPSKVVSSLRSFADRGYREVVLTGIHLGKYGHDLIDGMSLKALIKLIGREKLSLRIRLSSIEPKEVDEDLIEMVASEPWLCRHFHIPLQSGDDAILRSMNRHYSSREFGDLIREIRGRIPLAAIGVDVMAGFPGEEDQAFQNTHDVIEELPISYLHVFPFSPRSGTPAASSKGQVKEKVIKKRAEALRFLGQKKRDAFYRSCLGQEFMVLAEGWESKERKRIKGWSDNYLPVVFPSSRLIKNEMVSLRIRGLEKNQVVGSPLQPE